MSHIHGREIVLSLIHPLTPSALGGIVNRHASPPVGCHETSSQPQHGLGITYLRASYVLCLYYSSDS